VPQLPGNVGIKVIAENSPAPKGSLTFTIMPDSYVEDSKEVKYEEYGITWLYTTAKVDVFKTSAEVRAFYKIRGIYTEKTLESGDILMTTGNKAEFRLITISPRSNFCLVTLEHVRPTPDALKELPKPAIKTVTPVDISVNKPIAKPKVQHAKQIIKKAPAVKKMVKNKIVKKEQSRVVKPNIIIKDVKPIPVEIRKEAPPANTNITPVKIPETKLPSGVKKVVPKLTKPKPVDKKSTPFFEG